MYPNYLLKMNYKIIKAFFAFIFISGFPIACDYDVCPDRGPQYKIDDFSAIVGELWNSEFKSTDSVRWTDLDIQILGEELTYLSKMQYFSFGSSALALSCEEDYSYSNPVSSTKITASDTLWFTDRYYLPGEDITKFFARLNERNDPQYPLIYYYDLRIRPQVLPVNVIFHIEIITKDYLEFGDDTSYQISTPLVHIYS